MGPCFQSVALVGTGFGYVIVMLTVCPGVRSVMLKEKKSQMKSMIGLPSTGISSPGTLVRFSMFPASTSNNTSPHFVDNSVVCTPSSVYLRMIPLSPTAQPKVELII